MKKVLILGASGMVGWTVTQYFKSLNRYIVTTTARTTQVISPDHILDIGSEVGLAKLESIIEMDKPDIIINCIGLLVDVCDKVPDRAIYINSYFPHYLARITKDTKIKCVFLSTDCVFSGKQLGGKYSEISIKDGKGFYAQSKSLGEIVNEKDLTIRMSTVGKEFRPNGTSLFTWFMKQKGVVTGFRLVYWSGITTLEFAKQLDRIFSVNITGLYQLAPPFRISKYELLKLIQQVWLKTDVEIIANDISVIDKTLKNNRISEYNPMIPCYLVQLMDYRRFLGG